MAVIRKATKDDIPTVVDFFVRMYRLNSEFDPLLESASDLEQKVKEVVEKCVEGQDSLIVVAEEDGKIVGAARITIVDRMFYEPKKEALIREFYVHPAKRREGIGQQIFQYLESELKKIGISVIGAMFPARNLIATSFYKKLGFRDIYYEFIKRIE